MRSQVPVHLAKPRECFRHRTSRFELPFYSAAWRGLTYGLVWTMHAHDGFSCGLEFCGVTGPAFSGLLPVAAGQLITVTQGNEPYAIGSHAQR